MKMLFLPGGWRGGWGALASGRLLMVHATAVFPPILPSFQPTIHSPR